LIDTLITSKTRVKLLLKFFLNSRSKSYLRNLETEFGESTNAIRVELNRFEEAGLLQARMEGNRKYFSANTMHPLFPEINSILKKYIGIDQIIENILRELGGLKKAYLTGDLAKGLDCKTVELLLVCNGINQEYLGYLSARAEAMISRKIRYHLIASSEEARQLAENPEALLVWQEK
jgi:hypothetical protein